MPNHKQNRRWRQMAKAEMPLESYAAGCCNCSVWAKLWDEILVSLGRPNGKGTECPVWHHVRTAMVQKGWRARRVGGRQSLMYPPRLSNEFISVGSPSSFECFGTMSPRVYNRVRSSRLFSIDSFCHGGGLGRVSSGVGA